MWLNIQIFGFQGLWSPWFMLFMIALGILYYMVVGPMRYRFTEAEKPSLNQQILFYGALVLLYIIKGSPIDLLSHIMFSAHMVQTALFYFVFPILLIKGIPVWLLEKLFQIPVLRHVLNLCRKPLVALLIFNGLLSIYHIPVLFDFTKSSIPAHSIAHIILLVAALLMWLPILSPIDEHRIVHPLLRISYFVASSTIITISCALIIFSSTPLYTSYSADGSWIQALSLCVPADVLSGLESTLTGPEMFSPLNTLYDQQLGGVVMKVIQEIVYGTFMGRIFFRWFKMRSSIIDPMPNADSIKQV